MLPLSVWLTWMIVCRYMEGGESRIDNGFFSGRQVLCTMGGLLRPIPLRLGSHGVAILVARIYSATVPVAGRSLQTRLLSDICLTL